MSSPPVLDIDALLLPISDAAPAGKPLPDVVRMELDELRKKPDPDDPTTAGRSPDWNRIVRVCTDALSGSSKDLIAACRLLEAVTEKEGVPGVRDGLKLLHRLIADCWDRVHPMPVDGEGFDIREGPFKWINDVTRGAKYPYTVTEQPLVRTGTRGFSYLDWLRPDQKVEFEAAIPALKPKELDRLRETYADLTGARQELQALAKTLDEKLGADVAPDFLTPETSGNLGTALNQCIGLVEEVARRRSFPLTESAATAGSATAAMSDTAASHAGGPVGVAGTREGLYRQLEQIAAALRHLEPHSPIPYVLDRCVRLGGLPFPELMRAIIRENAALDDLDRLMGLDKKE